MAQTTSEWNSKFASFNNTLNAVASAGNEAVTVGYFTDQGIRGFVYKSDSTGALLWSKQISFGKDEVAPSWVTMEDNGTILISGYTQDDNLIEHPIIICLNSDGNIRWSAAYATPFNCAFSRHCRTHDGGIAIIGRTAGDSVGNSFSSGIIIKTDSIGNPLWAIDAVYPTVNGPAFRAVLEKNDSTIVVGANFFVLTSTRMGLYEVSSKGALRGSGLFHITNNSTVLTTITRSSTGDMWGGGFISITGIRTPVIFHITDSLSGDRASILTTFSGAWITDLIAGLNGNMIGVLPAQQELTDPVTLCTIDSQGTVQNVITLPDRLSSQSRGCRLGTDKEKYFLSTFLTDVFNQESMDISTVVGPLQACNSLPTLISRSPVSMSDTILKLSWVPVTAIKQEVTFSISPVALSSESVCGNESIAETARQQPRIVSNPVYNHSFVGLRVSDLAEQGAIVILRDVTGREVYRTHREAASSGEQIQIPTAGLASGVYTVELLDANSFANVWRGKVVVE